MVRTFSERLKHARELADALSGRELAKLAELKHAHVALIESGKRPNVEAKTLQGLARVLGVSLDWLLNGDGKEPSARAVRAAVEAARAAYVDQSGEHRAVSAKRTGTDTG